MSSLFLLSSLQPTNAVPIVLFVSPAGDVNDSAVHTISSSSLVCFITKIEAWKKVGMGRFLRRHSADKTT